MDQLIAARPTFEAARSYWTVRRGDSERAFRNARAHSRKVRALRLAVPLAMIAVLTGFVMWTWLNPMGLLMKVPDVGGDLVISGTTITMQQPRISGMTRDSRPYEFTAEAAAQDLTRPDVVELRNLRGLFRLRDDISSNVVADTGVYNSKKEMLDLGENSTVTTSNGYKIWLDRPSIDIRGLKMVTEHPVKIEMQQGVLNAQRMEVRESGNYLQFDNVKMLLKDNQLGQKPADASAR